MTPALRLDDDRSGLFSIGLRVVAYDHHLIAESSVSVPGYFYSRKRAPSIPASLHRYAAGDAGIYLHFCVWHVFLSRLMKNVLLLMPVRHIPFVGIFIPGRQDKRSDRLRWPWRHTPQNDSWLDRWK